MKNEQEEEQEKEEEEKSETSQFSILLLVMFMGLDFLEKINANICFSFLDSMVKIQKNKIKTEILIVVIYVIREIFIYI